MKKLKTFILSLIILTILVTLPSLVKAEAADTGQPQSAEIQIKAGEVISVHDLGATWGGLFDIKVTCENGVDMLTSDDVALNYSNAVDDKGYFKAGNPTATFTYKGKDLTVTIPVKNGYEYAMLLKQMNSEEFVNYTIGDDILITGGVGVNAWFSYYFVTTENNLYSVYSVEADQNWDSYNIRLFDENGNEPASYNGKKTWILTAGSKYVLGCDFYGKKKTTAFKFNIKPNKEHVHEYGPVTEVNGKFYEYCKVCNYAKDHVHDLAVIGAVDATCGCNGYTGDTVCVSENNKVIEAGEVILATGDHQWGSAKVIKAATGKKKGILELTCSECKSVIRENIPVMPALKINKMISNKNGCYSISWKAIKGVGGYEVELATDKKFKNARLFERKKNVTSIAMKNAKSNKVVYARVRYYKMVRGIKAYSTWKNAGKVVVK